MEKFNRAERLAQVKRLKNKRKNYYGFGRVYGKEGKSSMTAKQLGSVVQTPQPCSCFQCCNTRKLKGISFETRTAEENSFLQLYKSEFYYKLT